MSDVNDRLKEAFPIHAQIGRALILNADCMEALRQTPDKYFDLAIVDPPYGIGISSDHVRHKHTKKAWDTEIPTAEYFYELMRVSDNQIIWGGNYFLDFLGQTQSFLIWDKVQPHDFSLAMCEMAWSSIQSPAKIWRHSVLLEHGKIHPTQKPVALYSWLLDNYAKHGQRILDTHGGSMSSVIAASNLGFEITCCELDEDYFNAGVARVNQSQKQGTLFELSQVTKPIQEVML